MKKALVKKLNKFLLDKENAEFVGIPATGEQILNAENLLGVKFSSDYIEFIKLFGGAYAGMEIHAFTNAESMGNETVIALTENLRKSDPEVKDTYVISDDGSGNPIMMNKQDQVLIYYHDCGKFETLSSSLGDYIEDVFEPW